MRIGVFASIFILVLLFVLCYVVLRPKAEKKEEFADQVCPKHVCGAVDPVSDPSYNMKEIAKQSILLEEHIAEKPKRCKDCIAKHFLHIIGLSEEAIMLCSRQFESYPYMEDSADFYKGLFETWLIYQNQSENESEIEAQMTHILEQLRQRRKQLIETYYLHPLDFS